MARRRPSPYHRHCARVTSRNRAAMRLFSTGASLASMPCLLLLMLLLSVGPTPAAAASDKVADARGVPSDLPYIRCETCTHVARAAAGQADGLGPGSETRLSETGLLDVVEALCDPSAEAGRWAKRVDLVERVGRLRLVAQEGEQDCKRECRTLALACRAVLDGVETELAERLYTVRKANQSAAAAGIDDWLCAKKSGVSGACNKRAPFLPRDRPKGPPFEPKDEKALEMEKLMEQMKAMNGGSGMGMDMMTRDQAMQKAAGQADDDDDDDDDDDSKDSADKAGGGDDEVEGDGSDEDERDEL